jgi:apolipoprotein N-acyltransferase
MRSISVGVSPREALFGLFLGLLSAASFPPIGAWPLSFVSIALLLRLLRDRGPERARNIGLIYGLVYGLGTMYWFFGIFRLLAIPLIALFAGYHGLLATLIALTRGKAPLARAALVALFAVAVDWLRGDAWYLRFPWYTAPHALALCPPCIAAARWLGTYGLTYAVWLIAGWGAFGHPRAWAAVLLLPACALLLPAVDEPDRRALLMQTEDQQPTEFFVRDAPAEKVDLAVLPEYAFFSGPEQAIKYAVAELNRKLSCPVVFGAVEREVGSADFQNVAAVLDADGRLLGTFPKQRPLPLFNDGLRGTRRPVFAVGQGVLGVGICYDFDAPAVAASLVRSGATVLVVPTFDAMSWSRTQHVHHELLVRLRAVENDRWVLRATSSGRSEAVNPRGVPSEEGLDIGAAGFVHVGYAHRGGFALGGQLHVLGPAAAAGTVVFFVVHVVGALRSRRQPLAA